LVVIHFTEDDMAGKKRDAGDTGRAAREREARRRGAFEKQAGPGGTNRDHPDAAGATRPVPGTGIVSAGRDASAETNDPNYSAQRVHRAAPRDAGVSRMDTSGRGGGQGATHSPNPRLVRDVMTADVEVCNPDTDLYYVARMMMERDCGAIPVVESTDSMRPVGVVTDRDIVVRSIAKNTNPLGQRARDCMSADVATIPADALVEECVRLMEDRQLRRVLVVDNTGRLCGIVAQADVAEMGDEGLAAELLREVSEPMGGEATPT
jgi:CBS domain-containing protein